MPEVMELYDGLPKITYRMTYSAADRYKGGEVMFFSKGLSYPETKNPCALKAA